MRIALAVLAVCHLALLCGCGETSETPPEPPTDAAKVVAVPRGSSISVEVGSEDEVKIVITVPDGQPGAGTYSSTSPHLVTEAQTAMKTLGDPGVEVAIKVDASGVIQSITHSVTLR